MLLSRCTQIADFELENHFTAVKSRTTKTSLRINRIFRTFGAASNKKLRPNLSHSTTWILFGNAERLIAKIMQIIDRSRLLHLSAPKVRKIQTKYSSTANHRIARVKTFCVGTLATPLRARRYVDAVQASVMKLYDTRFQSFRFPSLLARQIAHWISHLEEKQVSTSLRPQSPGIGNRLAPTMSVIKRHFQGRS